MPDNGPSVPQPRQSDSEWQDEARTAVIQRLTTERDSLAAILRTLIRQGRVPPGAAAPITSLLDGMGVD